MQKFLYMLFGLCGLPYVIVLASLAFINVNKADNAKDVQLLTAIISTTYIAVPVLIIIGVLTWAVIDRKKNKDELNTSVTKYSILSCRVMLAAVLSFYGLSKLMGDGQFHISFLLYANELGNLSGSVLSWAFFDYSKFYNYCIGAAEIIGALLLLSRRTALGGAIFLLPVLINILLIDFNFDISAKDIITALTLMDIFVIVISIRPLFAFFGNRKPVDPGLFTALYNNPVNSSKARSFTLFLIVSGFAFFTNYKQLNDAKHSPIEGAWNATSVKNYSDTLSEKNKDLRLKLLVDGNVALVKKCYQDDYFDVQFNKLNTSNLTLTNPNDKSNKTKIDGSYKFISRDSMVFTGKDGADSVQWTFKKYQRNK